MNCISFFRNLLIFSLPVRPSALVSWVSTNPSQKTSPLLSPLFVEFLGSLLFRGPTMYSYDAVSLKSERCSEILCNVSVCCVCVCRPPVPYGHTQRECLVSFSPSLTFNLPILDLCPWVFPSAMIFFHLSSFSLLTPFHPFPPITLRTLTLDPPFTFDLHLLPPITPDLSLQPWLSFQGRGTGDSCTHLALTTTPCMNHLTFAVKLWRQEMRVSKLMIRI